MNPNTEIKIITRDPFDVIKSAVDKAVDLIKPTYGPAGNKVIIDKQLYKMVVDDGVQILRDLTLPDPNENAVLNIVRETAIKTNDRAGDGTTGASIMVQAIVDEVARLPRRDGRKIERELKAAAVEARDQLLAMAKPVKTLEDLKKVARVSYDNPEVSELIAEVWHSVGKDGVVTVDGSAGMSVTSELSDGLNFKRGYVSPYMVTNPERMEAVIDKPYILLTDYRLTEAGDILPIMTKLAEKEIRNLVIICENIEQSALATAIVNKAQGKFSIVAINMPPADNAKVMLEDIALLTGGKVFTMDKGDKLDSATIADLGRAERFIARRENSVIVKPKGKKEVVKQSVADLSAAISLEQDERTKESLQKRMGLFTNKVAVIKVGAATEQEQKALKYKVEDAVNAVRAAYKGGVVCGGGLSLARLRTSSPILNEALKYPHKQLMINMGLDDTRELLAGEALNVVTGKVGDYMAVGVIDPVDVLVAGVESAVSIVSLLLTTSGMLVEHPKPESKNNQ